MPPRKPKETGPMESPYRVVIDTREKSPFTFCGVRSDARDGGRPLTVRTVVRGLPTGDYSLEGYEGQVAVERKSLADLYGTLSQGRDRFQRELERLDAMECAAVVIEAGWQHILSDPPAYSKLPPKIVFRSLIAWQQKFRRVHWWPVEGRRLAEVTTLRVMEYFWRSRQFPGAKAKAPVPNLNPPAA